MLTRTILLLALVVTVALPFVLRPKKSEGRPVDEVLVIVTPHNEAIRFEFGRAFERWYQEKTGRHIVIDWRALGGTSEIARYLEGEYVASFQRRWTGVLGREWSLEVLAGFQNPRLPPDAPAEAREARAAFLASEVGCGIDLFFGGGTYDFMRQAAVGRLVDCGVVAKHPEWFGDDVIPHDFAGEEYWDRQGRWIGVVLSSYGMIFNRDVLKRLGIEREPTQWTDLQDPRFLGEIGLADPTKSGSMAKAFETVIQQQMQRRLITLQQENPEGKADEIEAQAVREGWLEGLKLLQRIGANARYFTDSAQKPPIDVAAGNCAVGMCIDFYGRQQEESVNRRDGKGRVGFRLPPGGTVASVDPIGLLRGAPNREAAVAFIEFTLSMEGQKLWNFRPGTPGGPERFALRRLPVRRDFYEQPEFFAWQSDPEDTPFAAADRLVYRAGWTGGLFLEMSLIIRIMCLDTGDELGRAWRDVLAAGSPPEALAMLQDLSMVDYDQATGAIKRALGSRNRVDELRLARELGDGFRARYARASELARGAR